MGTEAVLFTPAVGLAIVRVLTLLLIPALPPRLGKLWTAKLRRAPATMAGSRPA